MDALLNDLKIHARGIELEVLLTVNVPEALPESIGSLPFSVKIIHNTTPLGFAENHNRALRTANGAFFCIVNPDIRIVAEIFQVLLNAARDADIGLVAPLVIDTLGNTEDSARLFPTPLRIIRKAIGRCRGGDYVIGNKRIYPDWVGGMFMLCRREVYARVCGFDEKFFLYYEDVDLCARIWLLGLKVALVPQATVIHDARRASHKRWTYFLQHLRSMSLFFISPTFARALYLRKATRGEFAE